MFRGLSKSNLPGYVGFFQCLRNARSQQAFELVCPRIMSTDLNDLRLLASFGETGWFGGLAPFSCAREGHENRAIPEGKFLYFPR